MYKFNFIIIFLLVSLSCSCYSTHYYTGDGEFIDNGYSMKGGRYTLRLLEVPLDQPRKYKFKIQNLPSGYEFTAGLKINKNIEIVNNIESSIKIELFTDKGELVINEVALLNQWTLSHSMGIPSVYAYIRGEDNEQPLSEGAVKLVPIYTGVDCGKGTYFQPRRNSTYYLEVTIAPTKNITKEKANIMMNDVGQSSKCPYQNIETNL